MARYAGRNARLFIEAHSGVGDLVEMHFISNFEESGETDRYDVTSYGDTGKVEVAGLPGRSGTFSGFDDDATNYLYQAALDGQPRYFQFYPNYSKLRFTYGNGNWSFTRTTPLDGAVAISGNWSAAGPISTYP